MATYLQLARELRRETERPGTATTPSAVTNQTGENLRLVEWVKQAWTELQSRHPNWRWLRSTWSVNTVSGDDSYAGTECTDTRLSATVTRFRHWWALDERGYSNVKSYLQSAGVGGEGWLTFVPWPDFRGLYKIGTQNNGTPAHFTIDPQNNLVLGPKPNAVFVVSGEYQMSAQILAADGDVPEMPSDFHQLIVYEAMRKFSGNAVAPEALSRAVGEGNRLLRDLELDQLPDIALAEPMA